MVKPDTSRCFNKYERERYRFGGADRRSLPRLTDSSTIDRYRAACAELAGFDPGEIEPDLLARRCFALNCLKLKRIDFWIASFLKTPRLPIKAIDNAIVNLVRLNSGEQLLAV